MEKLQLRDVCTFRNGKAHEQYVDPNGEYILVTSKFISSDGKLFRNTNVQMTPLKKNEICMVMSDVPNGKALAKCFLVDEDNKYTLNQRIGAFDVDDRFDKKYFYYLMNRNKYFLSFNDGNGQTNLRKEDILNFTFDFIDINTQKEIVYRLDKIKSIIAFQKHQIQLLDDLVKARFVEMFGDNDKKVPISSLCEVSGGYSFKSGDISSEGAVRILQIGNVYLDDVNWETTNYLPEGFDDTYSRFLLNEGDIVVALTRPIIQSLGNVKACIVKETDTPCLLNQRVGRIIRKQNIEVNLKFIYGCLMADDFTRYVESCSIGCSQPNISTKDIENYLIPDVSYDKQMEFVKFKEQLDKSRFTCLKLIKLVMFTNLYLFDKIEIVGDEYEF